MRPPPVRHGYTLLEVILALAVSVLLLAGLYVALDIQIGSTHAGRKLVEQSTVARYVVNRITSDVLTNLGPVDPTLTKQSSSGGTTTTASTTTTTSGATTTTTTMASGTTGSTSSSSTASGSSTAAPFVFNLGIQGNVQGGPQTLSLYVSRLPTELFQGDLAANPDQQANLTDLRRVTYWLATNGGLARQEVKNVTSNDDLNVQPPNVPDEQSLVIQPEVSNITFEFFDGTTWQPSWDGTQLSTVDNKTPIGPPAAIRVTMTIVSNVVGGLPNPDDPGRTYQYVIPIPTANSCVQSSGTSGTTTGGTQP
jgi:prepilin-type N-terminal cleavage/methylation domain-containing protein